MFCLWGLTRELCLSVCVRGRGLRFTGFTKDAKCPYAGKDPDKIVRMRRLIWVFVGTRQMVRFLTLWLSCCLVSSTPFLATRCMLSVNTISFFRAIWHSRQRVWLQIQQSQVRIHALPFNFRVDRSNKPLLRFNGYFTPPTPPTPHPTPHFRWFKKSSSQLLAKVCA